MPAGWVPARAGRRRRDAGGVDPGVDAGERRRHVLRAREVADDGAARFRRQGRRTAQQHAEAIAALRQLAQEMAADEAGRAGEGDEPPLHAAASARRGLAKRASTTATRAHPAATAPSFANQLGQASVRAASPARARFRMKTRVTTPVTEKPFS